MFHWTFRSATAAMVCASGICAHLSTLDINVQCVEMKLMFKLKNFMLNGNDIFMCCSIPDFLTFLDVSKYYN